MDVLRRDLYNMEFIYFYVIIENTQVAVVCWDRGYGTTMMYPRNSVPHYSDIKPSNLLELLIVTGITEESVDHFFNEWELKKLNDFGY